MAATYRGHKRPSIMQRYVSQFYDRRRLAELGFSSDLRDRPAREIELLLECHSKHQSLEAERRKRNADKDRRKR